MATILSLFSFHDISADKSTIKCYIIKKKKKEWKRYLIAKSGKIDYIINLLLSDVTQIMAKTGTINQKNIKISIMNAILIKMS